MQKFSYGFYSAIFFTFIIPSIICKCYSVNIDRHGTPIATLRLGATNVIFQKVTVLTSNEPHIYIKCRDIKYIYFYHNSTTPKKIPVIWKCKQVSLTTLHIKSIYIIKSYIDYSKGYMLYINILHGNCKKQLTDYKKHTYNINSFKYKVDVIISKKYNKYRICLRSQYNMLNHGTYNVRIIDKKRSVKFKSTGLVLENDNLTCFDIPIEVGAYLLSNNSHQFTKNLDILIVQNHALNHKVKNLLHQIDDHVINTLNHHFGGSHMQNVYRDMFSEIIYLSDHQLNITLDGVRKNTAYDINSYSQISTSEYVIYHFIFILGICLALFICCVKYIYRSNYKNKRKNDQYEKNS